MRRRSKEEWKEVMAEYYASGQKQQEWCLRKNIKYSTFRSRISKIRKAGKDTEKEKKQIEVKSQAEKSVKFIELRPKPREITDRKASIKIEIGQARVEVPASFEADVLKELLKVVCEVC